MVSEKILPKKERLDKWERLQLEGHTQRYFPLEHRRIGELLLKYDKALIALEEGKNDDMEIPESPTNSEALAAYLFKSFRNRFEGIVSESELEDAIDRFKESLYVST